MKNENILTGKQKRNLLKEEFLEMIKDMAKMLPGIESPYAYAKRLQQLSRYGRDHDQITYYRLLKELKQKNLLKQKRFEHGLGWEITEKGRGFLKRKSSFLPRTDGFSTVIIFDIPVALNRERTRFRRYCIQNGYVLLQDSVLISRFKFSPELKELIKELKLGKFLKIMSARVDYLL